MAIPALKNVNRDVASNKAAFAAEQLAIRLRETAQSIPATSVNLDWVQGLKEGLADCATIAHKLAVALGEQGRK